MRPPLCFNLRVHYLPLQSSKSCWICAIESCLRTVIHQYRMIGCEFRIGTFSRFSGSSATWRRRWKTCQCGGTSQRRPRSCAGQPSPGTGNKGAVPRKCWRRRKNAWGRFPFPLLPLPDCTTAHKSNKYRRRQCLAAKLDDNYIRTSVQYITVSVGTYFACLCAEPLASVAETIHHRIQQERVDGENVLKWKMFKSSVAVVSQISTSQPTDTVVECLVRHHGSVGSAKCRG